jgi:4-hydroxy-tetrahydrodipicolinate reductase
MSERTLVIIGHGRMGRAVEALAIEGGWSIAGILAAGWDRASGSKLLSGASVAIEFSEPHAAQENVRAAIDAGCPVVSGTTGWNQQLSEMESYAASQKGALLWSPNFSIGAQSVIGLAATAAAMLRGSRHFDTHIIETHHSAKKDSPSGTALAIAEAAAGGPGGEVAVTSVRAGHDPGTHELVFDAPFEQVRIIHHVRDRRVFAAGALLAADWLRLRRGGGVFTMRDMLEAGGASGHG